VTEDGTGLLITNW